MNKSYREAMLRPRLITTEMLETMDDIREDGQINPLGAGEELEMLFNVSRLEARTIISYWMKTIDDEER